MASASTGPERGQVIAGANMHPSQFTLDDDEASATLTTVPSSSAHFEVEGKRQPVGKPLRRKRRSAAAAQDFANGLWEAEDKVRPAKTGMHLGSYDLHVCPGCE